MARNPTKQERELAEAEEARQRAEQGINNAGNGEGGASEDTEKKRGEFHNYKPPRRLIALEIIVIILLIILLLFEPSGFSAISMKGTDTVGLLSTSFLLFT